MLGKTVPVLLEKAGRTDGQWVGRTPFMQSVHIRAGADSLGKILDARISKASGSILEGHVPEY